MLTGAFFAVAVSYLSGAWYLGVFAAMLAGVFMAGIMAIGHIKFKADITAIGIGVNIFALALTKFLLNVVLPEVGGDPFIALREVDKGRTAAVTTDAAPHWAPPAFCNWEYYNKLWQNIADWLTK